MNYKVTTTLINKKYNNLAKLKHFTDKNILFAAYANMKQGIKKTDKKGWLQIVLLFNTYIVHGLQSTGKALRILSRHGRSSRACPCTQCNAMFDTCLAFLTIECVS